MPARTTASPDKIHLASLFAALRRNWRRTALLSLAAGGLAFSGLMLVKPTYTSEALIAIIERGGAHAEVPDGAADRESLEAHVKALQAPQLALRLSGDLQLAAKPEFNSAAGTNGVFDALLRMVGVGRPNSVESDEDRVLAQFAKRLSVTAARDNRTISIRFSARDRDLAAEIANRLTAIYREQLASSSIRASSTSDVADALAGQIERLKQAVAQADAELAQARRISSTVRSPQAALTEQQIAELTAAESKAKTELGEAEARARSARDLVARGSVEALPEVQRSAVAQKLMQDRARLETEIAKASATMKEGHPALKQLRSEMTATERLLGLEVKRVTDGFDKDVSLASLRLASVQRSLAEARSRVTPTGTEQPRLSELEANAKAKRGEFDRLQAQLDALRTRSQVRQAARDVQVIAEARPASDATFPKPLPYAVLAMVAVLLLTSAFLIARELVTGARQPHAREAARDLPHEPSLGEPTAYSELGMSAKPEEPQPADEGRVETISALAERMQSRHTEERAQRTLMAGAGASIDPGAEAVELVRVLARSGGTVLLLDWSLDGAGVARLLGMPTTPGLAELIEGKSGFVGAITRVPGSAAQLIPCGDGLVSASGRGDVDRLNLLLDTLDEIYDHIVVAARFNAARDLFETIEGRFDIGVMIGDQPRRTKGVPEAVARTFLGFEVEELEILRLARSGLSGRSRKAAA